MTPPRNLAEGLTALAAAENDYEVALAEMNAAKAKLRKAVATLHLAQRRIAYLKEDGE